MDHNEIRRIEELSLNAWPALRQMTIDGWLLRFADGCTRRSNSVQPLYPGTAVIRDKLEACAGHYARQDLPLIFKMTAAAQPADLDSILEQSGFKSTAHTSVQTCRLEANPLSSDEIESRARPTEQWLDFMARFIGIGASRRNLLERIVASIVPSANFAAIVKDGDMRAGGLAVCEGPWVGLFDIATAPDHRRRGYARRLLNGLLQWGVARGATQAYLVVMLDNAPALSLYKSFGFREGYQYWYRKRPS